MRMAYIYLQVRSSDKTFLQCHTPGTRTWVRRVVTPRVCVLNAEIPLGLPNHQALSCRIHCVLSHAGQGIEFKNARDLCEEPVEQAEVAARDPNDRRDHLVGPRRDGELDPLGIRE